MSPRKLRLPSQRRKQKQSQIAQIEACEQRMLLSGQSAQQEIASIDGSNNNLSNPDWGSVGEQLLRLTTPEYSDGISTLAGEDRASAREVSNAVASQTESIDSERLLTDYLWIWGQFLDHDIDLTEGGELGEEADIEVPSGDPFFDPFNTGTQTIGFTRSEFDHSTGTDTDNPRQQINQITAFIDGSVVYGSDEERAAALRTFVDGKLKTSDGDLLPYNTAGLSNAGGTSDSLFLAGDVRANENIALTAMHTIWVREHNRLAEEIQDRHPDWNDEQIYQEARSIVRAQLQAITYNEFLPALLGFGAIDAYEGYDATVNPGIANIFSTAAYRVGHSMLSSELQRLNPDGTEADEGNIALQNAFFNPGEIADHGIDSVLQGGAAQVSQQIDNQIIDDVRNFLFGPPGAGGFDLASLNIQRGRDHGLANYNQVRVDYGLAPVTSFEDISSNPNVVANLQSVYDSVDDIDAWVGLLAEDHTAGSSVGETMGAILIDQFTRLRDGDRFWYQNILHGEKLQRIERTTLADVIERNSNVDHLQRNVFYDASVMYFQIPMNCDSQKLLVRINGRHIEIVDTQNRQVIASQLYRDVDKIVIVGRDHQRDMVVIDWTVTEQKVAEGVEFWGGHDGQDMITVLGDHRNSEITVDNGQINNDGQIINFSGIKMAIVNGQRGNDVINANNQEFDFKLKAIGDLGNDLIKGSAGNDILLGFADHDHIYGYDGNDLIKGGSGNDRLYGGRGNDQIEGNHGDDGLYGMLGDDLMNGGRGLDFFRGGPGNDQMVDPDQNDFPFSPPPRPLGPINLESLAGRVTTGNDDQPPGEDAKNQQDPPNLAGGPGDGSEENNPEDFEVLGDAILNGMLNNA